MHKEWICTQWYTNIIGQPLHAAEKFTGGSTQQIL